MKRISAFSLFLLIFTALPSFAQERDPAYVAEPAEGSSTEPQGGYFVIDAAPGSKVTQNIAIRNEDKSPLTLRLAGVDAITGNLGGASYNISTEPRKVVGAWITIEQATVTLAPGASTLAPFDVNIPPDATTGEHLGGISISVVDDSSPQPSETTRGGGATINLNTRRIIAVQVNTPGDATPELEITGVEPAARPDGLYLEILVTNSGTAMTKGKGFIEVSGGFRKDFDVDTFLPATSIRYPIKWRNDAPSGEFTAQVEINYDGKVAKWHSPFSVGDKVKVELKDRQVQAPSDPQDPAVAAWVPAVGGGLAGLLLALLVWLVLGRRRKKLEPQHKEQTPLV